MNVKLGQSNYTRQTNEITEMEVWATSNVFAFGHLLRLCSEFRHHTFQNVLDDPILQKVGYLDVNPEF